MKRSKIKSLAGFTLIELIVVIGIIAVLAVALAPSISGFSRDKKEEAANENAKVVYMAFQKYLTKCEIENILIADTGNEYLYAIGCDAFNSSTNEFTVDQKITKNGSPSVINIDISNALSNSIRKGKWLAKIKSTASGASCEYTIDYACWTSENSFTYVPSSITTNVYQLNTVKKQDDYYKANNFALGTYPMG